MHRSPVVVRCLVLTLLSSVAVTGCTKRATSPEATVAPAPVAEPPPFETYAWVSEDERGGEDLDLEGDEEEREQDAAFAVRSHEDARSIAEAAVEDRLDPGQSWETSPALPAQWPTADREVVYLFYPVIDQGSLSKYQLHSAAYAVTVSLVDGSAEIAQLRSKKLGSFTPYRQTFMERNELENAQTALFEHLMASEDESADSPFWGYLRFFEKNPLLARDIRAKSPAFVAWLDRSH